MTGALDEFGLIARYFQPLARAAPGAFALGDDAAVMTLDAGRELVVTMDTMVAGVHFLDDDPPESVGHKLLAVNLSDLAAMGAAPTAYTLSTALPRSWSAERRDSFLDGFSAGLAALQLSAGCTLLGGDTVATPGPLTLTLTAIGSLCAGTALRRSGGRPGDVVFVSGTIGDAALGLALLQGRRALPDDLAAQVIDRYRRPQPRTALGLALQGLARAAIDVSDGLIADLGHICRQSQLGASIDAARVPLSAAARVAVADGADVLTHLLAGGDDYELLFCVDAERAADVAMLSRRLGLPLSAIGVLTRSGEGNGVTVRLPNGTPAAATATGWRHF